MDLPVQMTGLSVQDLIESLQPGRGASDPLVEGSRDPVPAAEELKDLCRQMEGIFIGTLMRQMRQTIWKSDFLPEGPGSDIFRSLYEIEMGERMAQRGGFGLAEALYAQLERTGSWRKEHLTNS